MTKSGETKRASPAFTTGGGGFKFEDRVGTWLVAALLAGQEPVPRLGVPRRVEFQQKAPHAPLDDVVVVGTREGAVSRWYASIKSYDMLVGSALMEFAVAAWQQLFDDNFDRERDFIGLVSGESADEDWRSLLKLVDTARHDTPERLAARIAIAGAFNEIDRRIWTALACPVDMAAAAGLEVASSPAILLGRLVPLRLDLRAPDSSAAAQAREWCRSALTEGHAHESQNLYDAVYSLVAQTVPVGGSIDWPRSQRALGQRFPLRLRPDAGPDWALLTRHTRERVDAVSDTLGGGLRLPRVEARAEIDRVADAPFVYLSGTSGCGKTALAKAWLAETGGSRLWLSARDLAGGIVELERRMGLRLPIADVLVLGEPEVRIVVDGLDRLYESQAHGAVASLARLAAGSEGTVKLLVTSQAFSLDRLIVAVGRRGAPAHEIVAMGDFDDQDVALAFRDRPDLQRLAFQGQLRGVLRRPKILEVVFQALPRTTDDTLAAVDDEAAVADLWWDQLALGAVERTSRGELLRGLAEWTGRELTDGLPGGRLAAAGLSAYAEVIDVLKAEEILGPEDDTYTFAHDLFADWTRYRALGDGTVGLEAVAENEHFPTWHRAIRIYALRTLRRDGIVRWSEDHERLRGGGHTIAADLFLDAPLFASDAETQIETLWPILVAEEGLLLVRMLNRFSHIATVPDPRAALVAMGGDAELQTYLAATWRVPIWGLWSAILAAVARRAEEAVVAAPLQVAAMAETWLKLTPPDYPGRVEAAKLGYAVGEFLASAYDRGIYFEEDDKLKLWRAFLAAGTELPEEVTGAVVTALSSEDRADWGDE